MGEKWKWINGFEGIYQISNYGRLKSFRKDKNGYICSLSDKNGWYLTVNLFKGNKRTTKRIHVLVAEAFIGEIPKGYHVHHKDGNKQNNVVSNLEIVHPSMHSLETVKMNPGFIKGMNSYNRFKKPRHIRQYDLDNFFIAEYANAQIASRYTGVCQRNILQVAGKEKYGKNGLARKQAGGYLWRFADEDAGGDAN